MTSQHSCGRDNAADPRKSGVSTHDPYRLTPTQWQAREKIDWGAIRGALERIDQAQSGDDS